MKTIQSFSKNQLDSTQSSNTKGGAYNIFCEIYIGRQQYKGEEVEQSVLNQLMKWDQGLNAAIQKYSN
ncbi:MAG: hypothetical protein AB8G11_14940 [Saprospiraceae bacterium]